jgi:hypothetical protein
MIGRSGPEPFGENCAKDISVSLADIMSLNTWARAYWAVSPSYSRISPCPSVDHDVTPYYRTNTCACHHEEERNRKIDIAAHHRYQSAAGSPEPKRALGLSLGRIL